MRAPMVTFLFLLAALTRAFATDAPAAAARGPVKMKITAGAKALLAKKGCVLEDGYFRAKGSEDKSMDLTSGGGALYAKVNPEDKETLAVGVYDRGQLYASFEAGCPDAKPWVSPFKATAKAAAKFFPKSLK